MQSKMFFSTFVEYDFDFISSFDEIVKPQCKKTPFKKKMCSQWSLESNEFTEFSLQIQLLK